MTDIRPVSATPRPAEARNRPRPQSNVAPQPLYFEHAVEPDSRRSLQDLLDAAEERLPQGDDPTADGLREIVDELERRGADALQVLQPVDPALSRLITGVDEQA